MLIVWSQYYVSEFNLRTLKNSSFDINQYYLLIHSFNIHGLTEKLIFLDIFRFYSVILM